MQDVGEEDPSVAAERTGDPDGQAHADQQVDDVRDDSEVHAPRSLERVQKLTVMTVGLYLNMFKCGEKGGRPAVRPSKVGG
ncbi:hypothetical protein GCM10010272_38290 [Streptomyces lateritius]|nr:hypothetical protein GCM10010272_38290 [Streptomyces lateritius]